MKMKLFISFLVTVTLLQFCNGLQYKDEVIQNLEPEATKTPEVVETPPKTEDPGPIIETPPPSAFEEALEYVGCYNDNGQDRALPIYYNDFRSKINWFNMKTTIKRCADAAKTRGYSYFAVQFYGECWSGPEAETTYDKYGLSENCWKGVGRHWTNAVYKFTKKEKKTGNIIS